MMFVSKLLFYILLGNYHILGNLPNICDPISLLDESTSGESEIAFGLFNGSKNSSTLHQTKLLKQNSGEKKHIFGNLSKICKTEIPQDSLHVLLEHNNSHTIHQCSNICSLNTKSSTASEQCRHKFGASNKSKLLKGQQLLKKNTYVKDDIIHHFTEIFRRYFKAQISDTMFCESVKRREWWPGSEYFDFSTDGCTSNKPSIFANKLLIPIFKINHWSLVARFKTVETSRTHDWDFIYLDSLNNSEMFNEAMGNITNRTSLARNIPSLKANPLKKGTNVPSYTRRVCITPKQEELECGCRLLFHMYLVMISNTASELELNVKKLHCVESLSKNVRRWAYNVMNDELSMCIPPGWFLLTHCDELSENIGK